MGTKVDKVSFYMNPNGGINAAAITTNGDLYQWGRIGLDTYAKPRYIMSDVKEVFAAQDRATYAAITKTDRKLFLWGDNCDGLAGQPYSQYENLTHKVLPSDYQDKGLGAFMDSVQEVYLGYDIGAALRENGDLLMWGRGYSSYQFMEDNSDEKYWNPKQLILSDVSEFYWEYPDNPYKIFSDSMSCAAIKKDGTLYMWGKNEYGQLGTGDNTDVATPQPVAGVQDVKSFHMENGTCAAVTGDGKLYMWGRNEGGSVGNGKQEICSQPVQVLSDEEVNSFTFLADARLSAALTKDKALYMWGVYDGHEHQYDGFLPGTIYTPELKLEQADKLIPYPTYYHDDGGTSFTDTVMYTKFACVKTDGTLYESVRSKNDGYFLEDLDEAVADSVCKVSYTGGNSYYASYYDNVIARGKKGSVYTWKEASAASEPPAIKRVYFFGGAEIIKPLPEEKTQASLMAVPAKISLRGSDPEASSDGGDSGNASRTEAFTGLRPNEIYNVYAMKSRAAEQPLASDNLLYIGQYVSDADGSLQADFEMKESCAEPDIFCVGMSRTDIAETEVEVPDILYDGSEHMPEVTVKYNGQTLTQGTDYKVYFKEYAKEIGEYELTVAGIGLYRGEKTVTFRVIEKGDDGDVSGGDISGGDVSGGDTPNETSDGGDKPGGDVSDGDVSGGNTPGGDISGNDTPGGDNPPPKPDYGDVLPQDVPKDGVIPEDLWIAGVEEGYGYTGSAIRPKVRVYDGKTRLTEKKDYIIAYKNNVKANDASVAGKAPTITVTGKGNYTGRDTKTFQILPLDIGSESEGNLFEADDIAIAGSSKAQKPVPELYWNGRKLKNRADYTVTYHKGTYSGAETEALPSVKEPGSYYVKLTGNTNFTGVRRVQLTVLPEGAVKPIAKAKAVKIPNQPYRIGNQDGAVTPEVVVKDGSRTLTRDVHYTVTYSNNKKVGTAYAIIRGIEANGYCGTKRVPFKITGIALKKASVTGLAGQTFVYDGTAKEPQLTLSVKVNGTAVPLVKDRDYSVRWQNNVNAGTAAVIFTGKNGYTGTLKKTFKIKAFNLAEDRDGRFRVEMEAASTPYAKGGAKPGLTVTFRQADGTVRTLKEGTDYTVTCKNNRAVNDGSKGSLPTLTIRGKGNFSDVCPESLTYRITAQDISRLTLSAADKVYQNRGNIYPTKVTITDLDGKVLKAGTDYDRNLTYTYKNDTTLGDGTVRAAGTAVAKTDVIPAGTVICVAAAPKGNYTGTPLTGEYSIKTYSIAGAKVTIPAQTYTGRAITLDKADESQILVRVGGRKVDAGQFEIVRYSNRVNKGTATVTIRGIGNYGGEKTVKFKIKAKGFRWWWNR